MEYKYDAFISYRHAEKDTLIASEIQKSLERFRIPKAIQKQTGKQRFNRIFRDVEELPISSNLTEDLTEALRLSEFLIVICSYRTSESDWVKREIDTFLELHDYNKQLVLTVLVEGEPDEVIPEELRHDNIIHYLADGTFYCKDEVVEPLAANYRMPIAKARKTELPRLAASMLGCNYDDIIRRRKAFKRRRLLIETIVISIVAIALMTYIGWMLMKIQTNLRNAQMNQSRYLATESARLLDDGDRISALQLALAALENSDGTRRPVTSEAENALAMALGAYHTWGSSVSSPVWRYELTSSIVKYDADNKNTHIAILDSLGRLHIWDRSDHKETLFGDGTNKIHDFGYDKKDNLFIACTGYVSLYNSSDKTEKWTFKNDTITGNNDVMMRYYPDNEYLVVNSNDSLFILNAVDGSTVKAFEIEKIKIFQDGEKATGYWFSITRFLLNSDFSQIALIGLDGKSGYSMYVYDFKNDSWICPIKDSGDFLDASFDKDGNIMVLRHSKEDLNADNSYAKNKLYDATIYVELISSQGKSLWKTEYISTMRVVNTTLHSIEYTTKDKTKTKVVGASFGNRFVIVDKKNGKTIRNVDFPGSIISVGLRQSDETKDYYVVADIVTQNGMAYFMPFLEGSKDISSRRFFPDGTLQMKRITIDGVATYLIEDSTKRVVTEFSGRFSDKKFQGFDDTDSMQLVRSVSKTKSGDYLITFSETGNMMSGVDVTNNKRLWTVKVPVCRTVVSYDAFSSDNKYAYLLKQKEGDKPTYTCSIMRVNCLTGEVEDGNSEFTFSGLVATESNGAKIFAVSDEERTAEKFDLYTYDIASETVKKITVNITELDAFSFVEDVMGVSPDGKKVLVYLRKNSDKQNKYSRLTVDTETGKFTESECGLCNKIVWNEQGTSFAEANEEGYISVCSLVSGKERLKIDTEMRKPLGMEFYESRLYVVYNTDVLCSYDASGKQVMNIDLKHGDIDLDSKATFEFVRQTLFVTAGDYTDIINLLDKKSAGYFSGFICLYNKQEFEKDSSKLKIVAKTFTTGEGVSRIGWFEYKTVAKMIEQAKEYLKENGVTMSDEFRRRYGIE
ncbi:MAG: TIR domain-containing protein [Clostridiales bacterium]|nr:TIR domain-containing protein [Clostridiales bacterium]MBR6487853.1 TIR domain-containing protein [Clostridiales bacterium]